MNTLDTLILINEDKALQFSLMSDHVHSPSDLELMAKVKVVSLIC